MAPRPVVRYADIAAAIEPTGMMARGGFEADASLPALADGRPTRAIVMIGNAGGTMWPRFRRADLDGPDPLDRWTRATLRPIAQQFDAEYLHPSDEPFRPFQQWAQLADDVWPSPIGLLVHAEYGLWHAYRGALLFGDDVAGLPSIGDRVSPCVTCDDQPCLTTCPVGAFTAVGYDTTACRSHVRSGSEPVCLSDGCAARRACPVGTRYRYGPEQMRLHMGAFVGLPHA